MCGLNFVGAFGPRGEGFEVFKHGVYRAVGDRALGGYFVSEYFEL